MARLNMNIVKLFDRPANEFGGFVRSTLCYHKVAPATTKRDSAYLKENMSGYCVKSHKSWLAEHPDAVVRKLDDVISPMAELHHTYAETVALGANWDYYAMQRRVAESQGLVMTDADFEKQDPSGRRSLFGRLIYIKAEVFDLFNDMTPEEAKEVLYLNYRKLSYKNPEDAPKGERFKSHWYKLENDVWEDLPTAVLAEFKAPKSSFYVKDCDGDNIKNIDGLPIELAQNIRAPKLSNLDGWYYKEQNILDDLILP